MIRSLAPLTIPLLLNACSLVHDDLPNESPTLQLSRVICQTPEAATPDTLFNGSGDICRTRRGGEVRFEVRGADEDDDPLVYHWNAFGAGSFRDSVAVAENSWFAPESISSNSEQFIIQVTISDRACGLVPDPDDRQRCIDSSQEVVENFFVEVVQRRPVLSVIADTSALFSQPQLTIDAFGSDPDDDPLEYSWEQLAGDFDLGIVRNPIRDLDTGRQIGSQATIAAFHPGNYLLRVSISDGEATVASEIALQFPVDPPLPEGGTLSLTLPETGAAYEIDIYEYPNIRGELPLFATWFEANRLCALQGKRLCTSAEYQHACQGEGDAARPYTSTDDPFLYQGATNFGVRFCNTAQSDFAQPGVDLFDQFAPSGSFPNCVSPSGAYDMIGNMAEWVSDPAATEVVATRNVSDVIGSPTDWTCGNFSGLPALPLGEGTDYTDTTAVFQTLADNEVDAILIGDGGYGSLFGFRCCR